ncbi:MAG: SHOCT domain-containing protein [Desulfobacterales bacterium]|nr:SHOCT domain-containing protein [Desulfobacterales bacterium]
MKKIIRLLRLSAMLLLSFVLFACNGYNGMYYSPMGRGHMYGYGMYGMGGLFMGIVWIVILLVIGYSIYYFIKNKDISNGANETPLDILKKRYAKGEITKEEYEQMKEDLK